MTAQFFFNHHSYACLFFCFQMLVFVFLSSPSRGTQSAVGWPPAHSSSLWAVSASSCASARSQVSYLHLSRLFFTLSLKIGLFKSDFWLTDLQKCTEMYQSHVTIMPFSRCQKSLQTVITSRRIVNSLLRYNLVNILIVLLIQDQSMEYFGLFPLRNITFFQHICCTSVFNGSGRFWIHPLVTESNMLEKSQMANPVETRSTSHSLYRGNDPKALNCPCYLISNI